MAEEMGGTSQKSANLDFVKSAELWSGDLPWYQRVMSKIIKFTWNQLLDTVRRERQKLRQCLDANILVNIYENVLTHFKWDVIKQCKFFVLEASQFKT